MLLEKGREILKRMNLTPDRGQRLFYKMATESTSVTVRIIRSFEFRNIKTIVYHDVNVDQKAAEFLVMVKEGLLLLFTSENHQ